MRHQSAMEFMSTYAFMLLMVAFILIAIFYFAFPVQSTVPSQCNIIGGMTCSFAVYHPINSIAANMIFYLSNSGSAPINVISANVIINNRTFAGGCSTKLLSPGAASICNATIRPISSVGSQVKGYISISAGYCNSAVSQFGNAISQSQCSYTPVSYTGAFSTYSSLINANSITTTITSSETVPPQGATFTNFPSSSEVVFAGTSYTVSAATIDSHDDVLIQYYPCTGSCSVVSLGTARLYETTEPLSGVPEGINNFEACDVTKVPNVCSALNPLTIYGAPTVSLGSIPSSINYGSAETPAPSETDSPSAPSGDSYYIAYCSTSSSCGSAPTLTCTSATSCTTTAPWSAYLSPFNLGNIATGLSVGTWHVAACDTSYQFQIGSAACSALSTISVYPMVPTPTANPYTIGLGGSSTISDTGIPNSQGGGPYTYQWEESTSPSGTYTQVGSPSTPNPNTYLFSPGSYGSYYFELWATASSGGGQPWKSSASSAVTVSQTLQASLGPISLTALDLNQNPTATQSIPASISGGSGSYSTCTWIYSTTSFSGPYTQAQTGSCGGSTPSYSFTPSATGSYYFALNVIDSSGANTLTYVEAPSAIVVSSALTLGGITPSTQYASVGTAVTMTTGTASGGQTEGGYVFSWSTTPSCTSTSSTSTTANCIYDPASTGTQTFTATVTDGNDNYVSQSATVDVVVPTLTITCNQSPCKAAQASEGTIQITGTSQAANDEVLICGTVEINPYYPNGACSSPYSYAENYPAAVGSAGPQLTLSKTYFPHSGSPYTFKACDYSYYINNGHATDCSTGTVTATVTS